MLRQLWCLAVLAAVGCDRPSPYFDGVTAARVRVDGSVFDVRVRGDLAESIRVNPEYAPRLGPIGARAAVAMAQVSGCAVTGVLGDQAQQLGQLQCQGGADRVLVPTPRFDCLEVPSGVSDPDGGVYLDYDCDPY